MSEREQRRIVLAKGCERVNKLKGGRLPGKLTSRSRKLSVAEGETATTATLTDHRGSVMIEEVEGGRRCRRRRKHLPRV